MAESAREVLVTGSIRARPERIDELLALGLAHAVHREVEDPLRLAFVEEWADRAALQAHFAVPASRAFVKAAAACAAGAPALALYQVDALEL